MAEQATVSTRRSLGTRLDVAQFAVKVSRGRDSGLEAQSMDGRLTVGTAEGATLRLTDPTVSRFHVEFEATSDGIAVRDLGSTNGTMLGATVLLQALVREAVELDLGRTRVRLTPHTERAAIATAECDRYGDLVGGSAPMRALYAVLERVAPTSAPVLVTGESGTGKELAARAIHAASTRAGRPFEVIDCGGLPPTLIESELFGHERGAFTGATSDRAGAFERSDGGTLFIDELGELPLELQPKLLRALGEGEVRRLGASKGQKVDVRVVAATNRDLRREVNSGRFRLDLFYRLAVIQVRMPALREHIDDLEMLVDALVTRIRRERRLSESSTIDRALLPEMSAHRWPGNVRELRNYLEHYLILQTAPPWDSDSPHGGPEAVGAESGSLLDGFADLPMHAAREALMERFERRYVTALLDKSGGNVAEAARTAGVDRATLFRIIRRHGLRS